MRFRLPSRGPGLLLLSLCCGCPPEKPRDSTGPWNRDDSAEDTDCPARTWYADADDDGVGALDDVVEACAPPDGYVTRSGDCDDHDDAVYPDADETCEDGTDSDCDGEDGVCAAEGSLASATALLNGHGRKADAGRHMDVGDLNGDGLDDVVVGEMWADNYLGGAFVVSAPITESGAMAELGVELTGGTGSFEGGRSVGVGDANGDGYDDVLLGAPDADKYDAVLFFGPVTEEADFSDADVTTWCTPAVECGHGSDLGDVNGDGVYDALIGAGEEHTSGDETGAVYVLFGPLDAESLDLRADADAQIAGVDAGSEAGRVVCSGYDIDGDGAHDLLITAGDDTEVGPSGGAIYVVLSPVTDSLTLDDADGKLLGGGSYSYAGESLALGDLDGDGHADAVIGAYGSGGNDGAAVVVTDPAAGKVSLSEGEIIVAGEDAQALGSGVAARDLDGDGAAELLVGAGETDGAEKGAGAAYLYLSPLSGSYDPGDAAQVWTGEGQGDGAGSGVGFADLSGDGQTDVLVGAPGESTGGNNSGAIYLIAW